MAGDGSKVRMGAAWIYFGTVAGQVGEVLDLGYTKGGITFELETQLMKLQLIRRASLLLLKLSW